VTRREQVVPHPKVTIVGAGHVGATAAFELLSDDVADVVLVDVRGDVARGKALDMMHARSVERFSPSVTGSDEYGSTAGSDIIVVTAGLPRTPGMTRDDLLRANAGIVRDVVSEAVRLSPGAVVLCVTNPLDVMCHLAWRVSELPSSRVLGMGGVLDSARFAFFISEATGVPQQEIEALVVGAHGDMMVPLPRLSTAGGRSVTDLLSSDEVDSLVEKTVFGGAEVVQLLGSGSAYYAPAVSVAAMVRAILDDLGEVHPSCVHLEDVYGVEDVYLSVPAVLASGGVRDLAELELTERETESLRASAQSVRDGIDALAALE
jgi:malate dehydrogenase